MEQNTKNYSYALLNDKGTLNDISIDEILQKASYKELKKYKEYLLVLKKQENYSNTSFMCLPYQSDKILILQKKNY